MLSFIQVSCRFESDETKSTRSVKINKTLLLFPFIHLLLQYKCTI